MINGCDFCFIYLHHICTTELMGHLGHLLFLGIQVLFFSLLKKDFTLMDVYTSTGIK